MAPEDSKGNQCQIAKAPFDELYGGRSIQEIEIGDYSIIDDELYVPLLKLMSSKICTDKQCKDSLRYRKPAGVNKALWSKCTACGSEFCVKRTTGSSSSRNGALCRGA